MKELLAFVLVLVRPLGRRDERGDVPGWVLVTVMTAGLVMAIWGLADDQLRQMLKDALDSVKN
jgi:hypothetical protein